MRGEGKSKMPVGEVQNLVNKLEVEVGRDRIKSSDRNIFVKITYLLRDSQGFSLLFFTILSFLCDQRIDCCP